MLGFDPDAVTFGAANAADRFTGRINNAVRMETNLLRATIFMQLSLQL